MTRMGAVISCQFLVLSQGTKNSGVEMVSEGIVVTGTFLLSGGVLLFEVIVRIIHSRQWFVAVAFSAIAMAALCWLYFKSQTQPDQKAVATAENEVYEAAVRDMVM